MSKKLKAVLSFALALVLVMSLGVSAFADSSNAETEKEKEKEPEIVQIAFNLGTMEPCAVRMRELGYDDIRIDGVSYRADAKDGVIAINLGDLAAIKLLRENTEKAKELGIDYANLYIRGGKVLVKDDTGLTSDQIAALQQAVASLMSSVRVGVNIGDIFDLANGEKVKLRVQVSNFIYPPQKETKQQIKVDTASFNDLNSKDSKKFNTVQNKEVDNPDYYNPVSAKTPTVTTLYFYFSGQAYADVPANDVHHAYNSKVGIAKDKDDNNTYYVQLVFSDTDKSEVTELKDLTQTKDTESFWDAWLSLVNKAGELAKKLFLSTDKEGKNVVKTVDIKNETPSDEDVLAGKLSDYTENEIWSTEVKKIYSPDKESEVSADNGDKAEIVGKEVIVRNTCEHKEWTEDYKQEATCQQREASYQRCVACGETRTIYGDFAQHNYVEMDDGVVRCSACMKEQLSITSTTNNKVTTLETPDTKETPINITGDTKGIEEKQEGSTEEKKEGAKTEETPKSPETPTNPDVPKTPETPVQPEPKGETPPAKSAPAAEPPAPVEPATAPTAKTGDAE